MNRLEDEDGDVMTKAVLYALCGGNEPLWRCWVRVMRSLDLGLEDIYSEEDPEKSQVALERIKAASHEVLSARLGQWVQVQRKIQPYLACMEKQECEWEAKGESAYKKFAVWTSEASVSPWHRTSGVSLSLDACDIFSCTDEPAQKACAFVRCDYNFVAAHVWGTANSETDVLYHSWTRNDTLYEIRKRDIKIWAPLVDHREAVYLRLRRRISDSSWAIIMTSVEVEGSDFFSRKEVPVRANIFSGFLIEGLTHGICRIVHTLQFNLGGSNPETTVKLIASGFDVCKNIESIKSTLKDPKLAQSSLALFAAGGAAAVAAGGAAGPGVVTSAVTAAGFTSAGIVAGSTAAGIMSSSAVAAGGGVASGGIVATAQSIGAAGIAGGPLVIAVVGGVAVTVAVTAGIYYSAKAIHRKVGDHKRRAGGPVHHCPNCDDRLLSKW